MLPRPLAPFDPRVKPVTLESIVSGLLPKHRSVSQWLAAVLLVTGWLAPLSVAHTAADDVLRATSEDGAALGQPRMTVGGAEHHPGHCVICHTIASLK
jgi:mono/diheme cytochrome c family protein